MKKIIGSACLTALILATLATPVLADRRHGGREWRDDSHRSRPYDHDRRSWRGDIRSFDHHDLPRWRSGAWRHGRHHGRLGWWWVVGGIWYFHNAPVYPYPDPYVPPVVVQQAPPTTVVVQQAQPGAGGYYPPVVTPQNSGAPASQVWYYCEERNGYYPYVPLCPGGWRVVPASPADMPR